MNIAIVGSGYVGLVTGACFADVGHHVICVDNDQRKIAALQNGRIPIYEPGLQEVVQRNVSSNRLRFTQDIRDSVANSQIIFIAVPTPPQADGSVDLTYIEQVAREISEVLTEYRVVVDKSTVPVKTGEKVADTIRRYNRIGADFDVVSNPEFLREGSAVADLMNPDRIIIGSNSDRAIALMKKVYEPFTAPILVTDVKSAELIKHAANSFLALKISYINAISAICETSGADVEKVAEGIGKDKRIGSSFLSAGIGYGGSCFPKDVAAFLAISAQLGVPFPLLKEVDKFICLPGSVEFVFHFASPASPVDYLELPIPTLKVGALGTHNSLGVARVKGAKFFLASTSECYGDPLEHPQNEDYWGNVNAIGPRGVYDEAKRFAESMTMAYHRFHGMDTKIVRIFNTYGPRMRLLDGRVVPSFISQALNNEPLTVFGDGSQSRSFCYVSDLIEGIFRLAMSEYHSPVNIGNPAEMTIKQFAQKILEITGATGGIIYKDLPVDDPKVRRPDIARARALLGWEPKVDFDKGIRLTIDYFQSSRSTKPANKKA